MKYTSFLFCIAVVSARYSVERTDRNLVEWENYKTAHDKSYSDNHREEVSKSEYFRKKRSIEAHNEEFHRGAQSFEMTLNRFADLTPAEFERFNGLKIGDRRASRAQPFVAVSNAKVADSVDWRQLGYVTEVKDQGECRSCWAFSATGALEGQRKRMTGKLVSLSEQNLIDCSLEYDNGGCYGGMMDSAFDYVTKNGGIDTEAAYPYLAALGNCRFNESTVGATASGFVDLPAGDEEALKIAVATVGPISVGIEANAKFGAYKQGVFYDPKCTNRIDHGVLVVGYGSDPVGGDFWLVKNSWGAEWGEGGFVRMARNRHNHCGIASAASYPLVSRNGSDRAVQEGAAAVGDLTWMHVERTYFCVVLFVLVLLLAFSLWRGQRRVIIQQGIANPSFMI